MSDLYVMQLASRNARWLSDRQSLIASNVANANTPGFRAVDLKPFAMQLDNAPITMATTSPAQMTPAIGEFASSRASEIASWEQTLSGNSVNLEQQMINLGDVNRSYQMNVNLKKALHQMLTSVLK